MQELAKTLVVNYYNAKIGALNGRSITTDDVVVVWFSKTLKNWKALLITLPVDGIYYELTHNGDKGETYLDAYEKRENVVYHV